MVSLSDDVRGSDLGLAFAVPSAVLLLALSVFAGGRGRAPERRDPAGEVAVQVMSVVDVGAAGSGGGDLSLEAGTGGAPEVAVPAMKGEEPPGKRPRARRRAAPSPTPGEQPAEPSSAEPSADLPPNPESPEGAASGPGDPGGEGGEPGGDGLGDGLGGGLAAKAISAYRERLIRWLSRRFAVRGSGLSQEQLRSFSARVEVDVSGSGVVIGYRILEASHPAFDRAARDALEAILGENLPPPPDLFPGAVPSPLRVTFICAESTCD